jgi:flagellar biosynthetic protein FliO
MKEWLDSLLSRLREQKGMTTWIWIVVLFVILGIGTLMGTPFGRPENSDQTIMPVFGSTGQLISIFLKWMAVIGLMYVAFIFLKRWMPGQTNQQLKQLAIIERLALSQRQAILLVRVGNRKVLLGATDQSISMITELKEGDETALEVKASEDAGGFNALLMKKISGNGS